MDLQMLTSPSRNASGGLDEEQVYPCVRKRFGYYFLDTMPVCVYSLQQSDRERLLGKTLCERVCRERESWYVYRLSCRTPLSGNNAQERLIKQVQRVLKQPAEPSLNLTVESESAAGGCKWKYGGTTRLCLPEVALFGDGALFTLFNSEKGRRLFVSRAGKIHKIRIEPEQGVVWKRSVDVRGRPFWKHCADYFAKLEYLPNNPLVMDRPRVFDCKGQPISDGAGEYYLNSRMVLDLFELKFGYRPPLLKTGGSMVGCVRLLDSDSQTSLIVQHSGGAHMTAVRLIRRSDRVVCYLHETLFLDNPVAAGIYDGVVRAVELAFPHLNRIILSPAFESQKDYSSCGVFAYKALCAFEKSENALDQWMLDLAEDELCSGTETVETYQRTIVTLDFPAVLLKMYQGDKDDLKGSGPDRPGPLSRLVRREKTGSDGVTQPTMTLAEYFSHHTYSIPNETGIGEQEVDRCLAATGKRYRYLKRWGDLVVDRGADSIQQSGGLVVSIDIKHTRFLADKGRVSALESGSVKVAGTKRQLNSVGESPSPLKSPRLEQIDGQEKKDSNSTGEGRTSEVFLRKSSGRTTALRVKEAYCRLREVLSLPPIGCCSKVRLVREACSYICQRISPEEVVEYLPTRFKRHCYPLGGPSSGSKERYNALQRARYRLHKRWLEKLEKLVPSRHAASRSHALLLNEAADWIEQLRQSP